MRDVDILIPHRFWFGDTKPFLKLFRQESDHLIVACVGRAIVEDLAANTAVGVVQGG